MKWLDVAVISLIAVWFVFSIVYIVRKKKNGTKSCGCGFCDGDCGKCLNKKTNEKNDRNE